MNKSEFEKRVKEIFTDPVPEDVIIQKAYWHCEKGFKDFSDEVIKIAISMAAASEHDGKKNEDGSILTI